MGKNFSWLKRLLLTTSLVIGLLLACSNISVNSASVDSLPNNENIESSENTTSTTKSTASSVNSAISVTTRAILAKANSLKANSFTTANVGAGNYFRVKCDYYGFDNYYNDLSDAMSDAYSLTNIDLSTVEITVLQNNFSLIYDDDGGNFPINGPATTIFNLNGNTIYYEAGYASQPLFNVSSSAEFKIRGGNGGTIWCEDTGGIVDNYGTLYLENNLSLHSGDYCSAVIRNAGELNITSSTIDAVCQYAISNLNYNTKITLNEGTYITADNQYAIYNPYNNFDIKLYNSYVQGIWCENATYISDQYKNNYSNGTGIYLDSLSSIGGKIRNVFLKPTFDANGGSVGWTTVTTEDDEGHGIVTIVRQSSPEIPVAYGKTINPLLTATRTGYTFNGWYIGSTQLTTSTAIKTNRSITASWTGNPYTVTLDQQGGSGGTSSVTATYGSEMPAITKPTITADGYYSGTRKGYKFNGYYSGTNGTGTKYYNSMGESVNNWDIAENRTLYAYWTPNIYKITFDNQSATTSGTTEAYYLYNTVRDVTYQGTTYTNMYYYADEGCTNPFSRTAISIPTKTGYTFNGYYTGTNGTGTQYIDSSGGFINNAYKTTGNKILYAYWTSDPVRINSTYYSTLQSAINAATDGDTIWLLNDLDETVSTSNKSITINLNGHSLGGDPEPSNPPYVISTDYNANLSIKNGTVWSYCNNVISNSGSVTLEDVMVYTMNSTSHTIINDGTLTVNSGTLITGQNNRNAIYNYDTVIINSGKVTTSSGRAIQNQGRLYVNGGEIEVTGSGYAIYVAGPSQSVDIAGGTITAPSGVAIYDEDSSSEHINIIDGTISSDTGYAIKCQENELLDDKISISSLATVSGATEKLYTKQTFESNGGTTTFSSSDTVESDGKSILRLYNSLGTDLPTTSRENYLFEGWYSDETELTSSTEFKSNNTWTANWKLIPYYITYNLNGGSSPINPSEYNSETPTFTLQNPIKLGYTFTGWTGSNGNESQTEVTITQGTTGDKSYTANWERDIYTITYNLNGGSVATPNNNYLTYNVDTNTFTLTNPTRTGYTFAGWTGSNGNTPQTNVSVTKGSTGNKSFVAVWNPKNDTAYKVQHWQQKLTGTQTTYNSTNYELKDTDNLTGTTGDEITPLAKTYTGFTTPALQTVAIAPDGSTVVNYYYTRNEYAFTLNNIANASTSGSSSSGKYYYGATITLKGSANTGYNWTRWDGLPTGTENTANTSFTIPDSDVAVTPVVTANTGTGYTVKHWKQNINGTATSYDSTNYTLADTDTPTGTTGASITPATKNYAGFSSPSTQSVTIAPDGSTFVDYYYTRNEYLFTLNSANGATLTGSTTTGKYYYGTTITLKGSANSGYTWTRWDGLPTGTTNTANTSFTMPAENVAVTPTLGKTTYTISYILNDGTVNPANPISYDVETDTITLNNPTKLGYIFDGWTGSNGTTKQKIVRINRGSTGNKTYTANFTRITYNISYDLNGGSVSSSNPSTYNVDTENFTLTNPTRTGYTFTGWTGSNGSTAQTTVTIAKGSTGDRSYSANWTANTSTAYKVQHWQQKLTGTQTTYNSTNYELKDTDNLTGTTGASISPATKTYTGFTTPSTQTVVIAANGTTEVNYYYTRNEYSFTLNNVNGATLTGSTATGKYYYGETITLKGNANAGYTWSSWSGLPTGTSNSANTSFTMPDSNVAVTPVLGKTTYTISYTLNGGSVSPENLTTYNVETDTITLNNPARTGYVFEGWTGSNGSTPQKIVKINRGSTGNKTYTANWTRITYNISYDLNGGSVSLSNPSTYNVDTENFTLTNPTKTGYTFIGWTGTNGSTAQTTVTIAKGSIGDRSYSANWSSNSSTAYKVQHWQQKLTGSPTTYDSENYDLKDTDNGIGTTGANITPETKTYTGFTAPSTQTVTIAADGSTIVNYYYTRNKYSFTLNNIVDATTSGSTLSGRYYYGATITLKGLANEGNTWTRWDGLPTGVTNSANTSFTMPASDVVVTPVVAKNTGTLYTVKHWKQNLNGTVTSYDSANYTLADTDTPGGTTGAQITPETKTYTGFTTPSIQTVTIAADGSTLVNYYYTRNQYSFTLNNIVNATTTGSSTSGSYYYGQTITLKGLANTGYTWVQWSGLPTGTSNTANTSFTMTASDVAVTPVVAKPTYTISYTLNGGTTSHENPTSYDVETDTITLNNPTRTGYVFDGWTGSNGSTPEFIVTIPRGSTGNKTYTANWTRITYNISYDLNGGSVSSSNPVTYNVDTTTFTLTNPSKIGYTFTGWTGTNGSTAQTTVTIAKGSIGDRNYSANWSANTSTAYKVQHWQQKLIGTATTYNADNYDLKDTDNLSGTTDTQVTPATKIYTGFTAPSTQTVIIAADGSTVVNYYYTRNIYAFTLNNIANATTTGSSTSGRYYYGATITLKGVANTGYNWRQWNGLPTGITNSANTSFTMPDGDVAVTPVVAENTGTLYTVKHWKQNLNGTKTSYDSANYTLVDTDTPGGTTGASITPLAKTYTGFTAPSLQTVIIAADGSTVVNYYYTRNEYSFTLNNVTGATLTGSTETEKYYYGDTITLKGNANTGYTWTRWDGLPTETINTANTNFTMPDSDVAVTPVVAKPTYTISYTLNGGSVSPENPTSYNVETDTITLNNPTRTGYVFEGWTGSNGSTPQKIVKIDRGSTGNKTYAANWTRITYNISYDLNGGDVSSSNPTTYNVDTENFTLTNPTKTGYTFIGWTGTNGSTAQTTITIAKGSIGDRSYSANWSANTSTAYKVQHWQQKLTGEKTTYNSTNYELKDIDNGSGTTGASISPATKTYTGFTAPSTQTVNIAPDGSTIINYYYTRNEYALTLNNIADASTTESTASGRYYYGATITLKGSANTGYNWTRWDGLPTGVTNSANTSFTMPANDVRVTPVVAINTGTGYTVKHWQQKLNGTKTSYDSTNYTVIDTDTLGGTTGTSITPATKDYTGFTAPSTQTVIIAPDGSTIVNYYYIRNEYSFTLNNIEGADTTESTLTGKYYYGQTITLKGFSKDGYTWTSWSGLPTGVANTANTSFTMPAENIEVTPVVEIPTYTISYTLNGGTTSPENPISYNVETDTITLNIPEKTGYIFEGWTGSNGSNPQKLVTIPRGSTGDKTFTANFTRETYNISYDLNEGSVSLANPDNYNVDTDTFTLNTPAKLGYTFAGWTGTGLTSKTQNVTIEKGSIGDRSYTANWTLNTYTINYNLNGGTATNPVKYNVETTFTLNNPVRDGYTFAGWQGTGIIGKQNTVTIEEGSTGTRNYVATWDKITYNISYDLNGGSLEQENPSIYNIETEDITLNNPLKTGYTFIGWTGSNGTSPELSVTIQQGSIGDKSYIANYRENTDTEYRVEHYKMTLLGDYSEEPIVEEFTGKTGDSITPVTIDYVGFTAPQTQTTTIVQDGSTVVKYYYVRNRYAFTLNNVTGADTTGTTVSGSYYYNQEIILKCSANDGYTFVRWSDGTLQANTTFTMPAEDKTISPVITLNSNTTYTVNHWLQKLTGDVTVHDENNYLLKQTDNLTAQTEDIVTPNTIDYTGFTSPSLQTVTVLGNGSTVINYYYTRNRYAFTLNNVTGADTTGTTESGSYYYEQEITLKAVELTGYNWDRWSDGTTEKQTTFNMPASDKIISPVVSLITYTIDYNLDGGSLNQENPATYNIETEDFVLINPTRIGYTFIGWTSADFEQPQLRVEINKGSYGNRSFVANWIPNNDTQYVVEHYKQDINSAEYEKVETNTLYGTSDTKVTPIVNIYEGFTLPEATEVNIDADGSRVVKYYYTRNQYELQVYGCEGVEIEGENVSGLYYYGEEISFRAEVRQGYTWIGWNDGRITREEKTKTITMPARNLSMTPVATRNNYTISYELNGGTLTNENPEEYNVTTNDITLNNPNKIGYTFTGWTRVDEEATEEERTIPNQNVIISKGSIGNKAYVANWETNKDTEYVVRHWIQNIDGDSSKQDSDNYSLKSTNNLTGETLSKVTPMVNTYEGFTSPEPEEKVIKEDGSLVIDYYYARNRYVLNVENQEGIIIEEITTPNGVHYYGEDVVLKAEVEDGYTWTGWYNGRTNMDKEIITTMPANNVEITATASKNTYEINYDLNGGILVNSAKETYTVTDEDYSLPLVTKEGYTFIGWTRIDDRANEEERTNPNLNVVIEKGSTEDKAYKANFEKITYTISYDLNGGNIIETEAALKETYTIEDEDITLPTLKREGYTFTGWTRIDDDATEVERTIPNLNVVISNGSIGNRAYKANFVARTDIKYIVKHWTQNLNGEKENYNSENYTVIETQNFEGTADTLVEPDVKVYEGFSGPVRQEVQVLPDESLEVNYYYTRNKYTFTLGIAEGADTSGSTLTGEYYYQEVIELKVKAKETYIWQNWSNGDLKQETTLLMPANDVRIFPIVEKIKYKVTYKDGQDIVKEEMVEYGSNSTAPILERPGYTLTWNKEGNSIIEETVINAIWTANTYRIEYKLNGGIAEGLVENYIYGEGLILPTQVSQNGYIFKGWYDNEDLEGNPIEEISNTDLGDKIFFAKWEKEYKEPEDPEQPDPEPIEKLYVRTDNYGIEEEYITKIIPETTIKTFKQQIDTNGDMKIFNQNGEEILDDESLVGTGYRVKITKGEESKEFTLIVIGDISGEGQADIVDVSTLCFYIVGKIDLSPIEAKAADIFNSGDVDITDLSDLCQYIVGIIKF